MTMSFLRSVLQTALLLFAVILLYAQTSFAEASDIEALNSLPAEGTSFYTNDTITFLGTIHNLVNEVVPESGYADIEIDWDSNDSIDVSENANSDYSENKIGQLIQNGTKQLQEVVTNPPAGTHRYHFVVDTINDVDPETSDENNTSSWVNFTVLPVPVAPEITFSATPNPLTIGNAATLTWIVKDASSCTGSGGSAGWSGAKTATDGTHNESVSPIVTTKYTISCTGPTGLSNTKSFTIDAINPPPTVTLTASANPINSGSSVTLTWSSTNADTCTASGGWSGTKITPSNQSVSPTTTTMYTLSCAGSGGTTTVSQSVTVNQPLPVITISAASTSIASGGNTTLIWSVTNATYCRGSNGGGLPWDASQDPVGAALVVSTIVSRDYILNCSNPSAGTTTNRVTVWVTGLPNLKPVMWSNSQYINTSVGSTTTILKVGEPNTIRARVMNTGSSTTGARPYTNRFGSVWGWILGDPIGYSTGHPFLDPGQINNGTYDESPSWTPTRAGHIELSFCTDSSATTTEQNESDNCVYRSVNVATSSLSFPILSFSLQGVANSNSYFSTSTRLGVTTTLAWNVSGASSCIGTSSPNIDPRWNGARSASGSNTFEVNPIIAARNGYNNYALICTGPGGETLIKTIRINVPVTVQPTVTITAASSSVLRGSGTMIVWTVTDANTCIATSTPSDPLWSGSVSRSGGSRITSNLSTSTNYKISCDSPNGTTIVNIQVDVKDPPPTISLTADSNPMTPNDTTKLTWTASGAASCTGTSNPADPAWDGVKSTTGGDITTGPDVTTEYTLLCTSLDGLSAVSIPFTVSVAATPPIIDFSYDKGVIIENKGSTVFTWNIRGASSCTGVSSPSDPDWDITDFSANGFKDSKTVSPTVTTDYSISCTGDWGSNPGQPRTITVIPEAVITKFKVCVAGTEGTPGEKCAQSAGTLEDVDPGTPLEVFWDSVDATKCDAVSGNQFSTANDATDGKDPTVSATPYADSTDTYTIVCGSLNYITSDYVTIHVHTNKKTPAIWITPKIVESGGGKVDVRWDTNNGDQTVCSIKGGGLTYNKNLKDAEGETGSALNVYILGRTSFVITCPSKVVDNNGASAGGTESATTTVELSPRIWGR